MYLFACIVSALTTLPALLCAAPDAQVCVFVEDMRQVWYNSYGFYRPGSAEWRLAAILSNSFEKW
jgi:hypothetical protein